MLSIMRPCHETLMELPTLRERRGNRAISLLNRSPKDPLHTGRPKESPRTLNVGRHYGAKSSEIEGDESIFCDYWLKANKGGFSAVVGPKSPPPSYPRELPRAHPDASLVNNKPHFQNLQSFYPTILYITDVYPVAIIRTRISLWCNLT